MTDNNVDLEKLINKSTSVIMTVHGVWPLEFFPDTIVVDHNKLTLIYRYFPWGKKVFPIHIKDVKTIRVITGLFLASVYVEITGYEHNPDPIHNFWKRDALELTKVVNGLITANKEKIQTEEIDDIKEKARIIGE